MLLSHSLFFFLQDSSYIYIPHFIMPKMLFILLPYHAFIWIFSSDLSPRSLILSSSVYNQLFCFLLHFSCLCWNLHHFYLLNISITLISKSTFGNSYLSLLLVYLYLLSVLLVSGEFWSFWSFYIPTMLFLFLV